MSHDWSCRPVRPEPENGWIDWELVVDPEVTGAPGTDPAFRLDLASGRLTREAPRRGATIAPTAGTTVEAPMDGDGRRRLDDLWLGTGLLVLDSVAATGLSDLSTLRSLGGPLRVVWTEQAARAGALDRLRSAMAGQTRWRGIQDATAKVGQWTRGRLSDTPASPGTEELMVPWAPGLWRARELEALGTWASSQGYAAVIPLVVDGSPRLLREFAGRVELNEERTLRLFVQEGDTSSLADHRAALASGGVRWWFERISEHPLPRLERIRRVSGALGLLGVLGSDRRPTGWIEGHRQAARRLETERIDVRDLLAEGNLRLLEWLDQRVGETLVEWFEADPGLGGQPPALVRLRGEVGIGGADRPKAPVGVADSRS